MTTVHGVLLLLAVVGALVHQAWFWSWFIEDAAISFAYARNLAWGEGLVPSPGGERVEGYSNPTWVALLALFELIGIDGFRSSKGLQLLLAALTLPLTYRLTAEASPRKGEGEPLVAAAFLATSTTFAIWGASGLENALFSCLLSAALLRSTLDIKNQTFPWASFLWFLLAITRPEAILYCAVAGALTMLFTLPRGLKPTLQWLAGFFIPFTGYHLARFSYFAYELPQTYYGKMTTKRPAPLDWDRRGWKYVREWANTLWTGYHAPLWVLALVGTRGARAGAGIVLTGFVGAWILLPDFLPMAPVLVGDFEIDLLLKARHFPAAWGTERAVVVVGWAVGLVLLGMGGRPGWQARTLCASVGGSIVFFAVYTMGDWMKAWRWMSLPQVPLAVLFAVGVGTVVDLLEDGVAALERRVPVGLVDKGIWAVVQMAATAAAFVYGGAYAFGWEPLVATVALGMSLALFLGVVGSIYGRRWTAAGWSLAVLAILVTLLPNMAHLKAQRGRPETGPFAIKTRVEFVRSVGKRLDLQHRIVDLDVDMGAHLWWGRDDFRMIDLAGLVDIPFAQHRFQHAFVEEYVFEETRPDFAHVHGNWANKSRIPKHKAWRTDYVEIPGFPAGGRVLHPGNFVRRSLFLKSDVESRDDRHTTFDGGWVLEELRVPSEPAVGAEAWLRLELRATAKPSADGLPRVLISVSQNGRLERAFEVPLLFDWVGPQEWRKGEVFVAGFPIAMNQLRAGTHDLGVALIGPDGHVLAAEAMPDGARTGSPVFAKGEVVFPEALRVVEVTERNELAAEDLASALKHAERGACNSAQRTWNLARWHAVGDDEWFAEARPRIGSALADCWARYAEKRPDRVLSSLLKAAQWDDDQERYLRVRYLAADELYGRGMIAFLEEDWDTAYTLMRDAVRIDPTRAWARRYAEKAREERFKPARTKE